jgi:hypothetical protein
MTTEDLIGRLGAEDLRGKLPTNPKHKWLKRDPSKLEGLCIHQSLGWSTLEQIAAYHTGPHSHLKAGGVHSISYTIGIRRSGKIAVMLDLEEKPWSQGSAKHPGDENAMYLSVVNEGMFRWEQDQTSYSGQYTGNPNSSQLQANLFVWDTCASIWGWDIKDIYGHYHFGKESCPGLVIKNMIEGIRNQFTFFDETNKINKDQVSSFLKVYGFKNVKEFQSIYNKTTNSSIVVDDLWGRQSTVAAYWWIQHRSK